MFIPYYAHCRNQICNFYETNKKIPFSKIVNPKTIDYVFDNVNLEHINMFKNIIAYGEKQYVKRDIIKKTSIKNIVKYNKSFDNEFTKWNKQMDKYKIKLEKKKYLQVFLGCMIYSTKEIDTDAYNKCKVFSSTYMIDDILDSKNCTNHEKKQIYDKINTFLTNGSFNNNDDYNIANQIIGSFQKLYPFVLNRAVYEVFLHFNNAQYLENKFAKSTLTIDKISEENEIEWYTLISLKSLYSRLAAYFVLNKTDDIGSNLIKVCPLIQLRDDMSDVEEDIINNSVTPFTLNYHTTIKLKQTPLDILEKQLYSLIETLNDEDCIIALYLKIYESIYLMKNHNAYKYFDQNNVDYLMKRYAEFSQYDLKLRNLLIKKYFKKG